MKIAIIGAGQMAKIFAVKAKAMGIESHCFAWEKGAVAKEFVDHFHPVSIFEKDEIVKISRKCGIDGVLATTELTVAVASYVANELGLPCNPPAIAEQITAKEWVRQKVAGAKHLHQPEFWYLKDQRQAGQLKLLQYPVIVKPVAEGGKRGITVVNQAAELPVALQTAFAADQRGQGVLVEAFLAGGQECSVESLSFQKTHQIIQITEKISSGPPHCVELGHSQPANISLEMREKIIEAVTELLDCVGYQNGPSHTEIKIIDDQVYLIELNSRPGGDHIAYPLTELSTGYDYIGEIIHAAVGIQPKARNHKSCIKYAGVRFVAKQTAFLKEVFDHCDAQPWLYEKHVESETLQEIDHNDCCHLNYFIYCADEKLEFPEC